MQIADRVAVLRGGRIEQVGRPAELEAEPRSAFVFDFLADANRIDCDVGGERARIADFTVPAVNPSGVAGRAVARFRPHETDLAASGIAATVAALTPRGRLVRIDARTDAGLRLEAEVPREDLAAEVGDRVNLKPQRVYVFPG